MIRRIVLRLAISAILVLVLAVPAFAQGKPEGKPEGKSEQGLGIARSICAASGLNDDPNEPFPDDGQVQSYGQYVKKGADQPGATPGPSSAGIACNPNNTPPEE